MRRFLDSGILIEILRPIGQIFIFVVGTGFVLSVLALSLALLFRGTPMNEAAIENYGVSIFTYTLVNLPQVLVDGVTIGFVYAAIALGYTMVYGVLEFINFAHSEIFAIGAFVGVEILIALNNSGLLTNISNGLAYGYLFLAMLAGAVVAGLTALIVERVAYRPLRNAPRLVPLISAIGVSFLLQDLIRLIESLTTGQFHRIIPTFGNFDQRLVFASLPMGAATIEMGIQIKSLIVTFSAVLMMIGLNYLVNASKVGKAIRSVAQDRTTASLMGINVNQIISLTFMIGGALGGAAGMLFALKFTRIDPFVGFFPGLKAFTAAVLGGIGNITGALLGGIVLGMLETFAGSYLSVFTGGAFGAEYKDILAFAILILVLILRPSGLLGEQVAQKAQEAVMKDLWNRITHGLQALRARVMKGNGPYLLIVAYLTLGTVLVYTMPRSLLAFLLFVSSALFLYLMPLSNPFKAVVAAIMLLILVPVLGARNIFYLEVIFQISVFAALALGLNIVVGFAGLLDLGYVAFYAVGAYLWAFFGSQQPYLLHEIPGTAPPGTPFFLPPDFFYIFIFLGIIVAAFAGIMLGLPVLRLRGDYLAIVTLGFGEVIRVLANNLDKPLNLTNGPQGITPIQRPTLPLGLLAGLRTVMNPIVGHNITEGEFYNLFFYLAALLVVLVVVTVARRLDDSRIGRAWTAIREDETAAIAMGIPLVRMKLAAFAAGASFAGAMGVMFAASRTFVSPESFSFMQSIGVLSMVILGGLGSIPGVILGAAVVIILNLQVLQGLSLYLSQLRQSDAVIPIINFAWKNLSTQLDPAKYQRLLFGIILILMMIYRPAGLIPSARRKRELAGDAAAPEDMTNEPGAAGGAAAADEPEGSA